MTSDATIGLHIWGAIVSLPHRRENTTGAHPCGVSFADVDFSLSNNNASTYMTEDTEGCPICEWDREIAVSHDRTHKYYTHVAVIDGELLKGRTCSMRTTPKKKSITSRIRNLFTWGAGERSGVQVAETPDKDPRGDEE